MREVTHKNGGLELAILEAIAQERHLTPGEAEEKKWLEGLSRNRKELLINGYDYYVDQDSFRVYRSKQHSKHLEQLPDKPIITRSHKNQSGGWIHIDIRGNQEWDLYEERKRELFFINGAPY